jgi:heat shock protein HslJ
MRPSLAFALFALALAVGCSREDAPNPSQSGEAIEGKPVAGPAAAKVADSELADTAWRLLNITSMDETIDVPDDPNKYTLEFGADGRASMRADCNRGTGSWSSESAGRLTFGPVAGTRALCPPPSLGEKYLAQFEWVRSYTTRDEQLFLATMADGSIIGFEPLPPVVATVLGEDVHAVDPTEMRGAVLSRLFDSFAADQGIEVTEAELDTFIDHLEQGMAAEGLAAEDELTDEEVAQMDLIHRQMGYSLIRQWKIDKSLYEAFGGRVIYQQLGPEPLDAYREYLQERQAAGDFSIADPATVTAFWDYFTDESKHDFMAPGSEDLRCAFTVPPWEG